MHVSPSPSPSRSVTLVTISTFKYEHWPVLRHLARLRPGREGHALVRGTGALSRWQPRGRHLRQRRRRVWTDITDAEIFLGAAMRGCASVLALPVPAHHPPRLETQQCADHGRSEQDCQAGRFWHQPSREADAARRPHRRDRHLRVHAARVSIVEWYVRVLMCHMCFRKCLCTTCPCAMHVCADCDTPKTSHLKVSGEKWDVYSLGVLFAFTFTETPPYPQMHQCDILHKVRPQREPVP